MDLADFSRERFLHYYVVFITSTFVYVALFFSWHIEHIKSTLNVLTISEYRLSQNSISSPRWKNVIRETEISGLVFSRMIDGAVCSDRKFLIPDAKIDEVTLACQKALKEMGLKIIETEKTMEGNTSVLAGERALVPLTLRTLLYPFSIEQYVKAAQRSGVHIVLSTSKEGVMLYSCGLVLDELTGRPVNHISDEDEEDITGTLEALDFENKFLGKIRTVFPNTKEI